MRPLWEKLFATKHEFLYKRTNADNTNVGLMVNANLISYLLPLCSIFEIPPLRRGLCWNYLQLRANRLATWFRLNSMNQKYQNVKWLFVHRSDTVETHRMKQFVEETYIIMKMQITNGNDWHDLWRVEPNGKTLDESLCLKWWSLWIKNSHWTERKRWIVLHLNTWIISIDNGSNGRNLFRLSIEATHGIAEWSFRQWSPFDRYRTIATGKMSRRRLFE